MKYRLLLPVLLALCGCRSDLYYQEQAVESAREYIFENARELTPEQFAFVRLTPPVLLTGPVLSRNEKNSVKDSLSGGEQMQICVTWRIPGRDHDYLVFGRSEPRMAFWRPLKLIRRRLGTLDSNARLAMTQAVNYAVESLFTQLSSAELNKIRFTHPALAETSFPLGEMDKESFPRPWKKLAPLPGNGKDMVQLSLLWDLGEGRHAVFCGMGKRDLGSWQIVMAGVVDDKELKSTIVKKLKSPELFLFVKRQTVSSAAVKTQQSKAVQKKDLSKVPADKTTAGGK